MKLTPSQPGHAPGATQVFEERESAVRSYCRQWPAVFDRAGGSWLHDESGRPFLDFFSGAGTLNYGHNNPVLKRALLEYLDSDRVVHSLDMFTASKREFLSTFDELVLRPRGLDLRAQFPGPGGTQAVEAALKLARKATGRTDVVCFRNGFHGVTLGSLAVTSNATHRGAAGTPLRHARTWPYDDPEARTAPDVSWFERRCDQDGGELPAAVIVETVQGEGGLGVARPAWLRALEAFCRRHDIPLIVDDVQMGCGRTGTFFSFEEAGITPDIVCLSKSLSGYGLPLALTLIREDLDIWEPGEHNGTFRGHNPAFVTATAALRAYWQSDDLQLSVGAKGRRIASALGALADAVGHDEAEVRGRGMARGLAFRRDGLAEEVSAAAFDRGLLVETAGPNSEVVKLLPPLTATDAELDDGLARLADAVLERC